MEGGASARKRAQARASVRKRALARPLASKNKSVKVLPS